VFIGLELSDESLVGNYKGKGGVGATRKRGRE